jgi:hypothetical protein
VTDRPYTDDDLRTEAARQYAEALRSPDLLEVGDEMQGQPIPSTVVDLEPDTGEPLEMSRTWGQLSGDDFHDARNEIHELLDSAPDVSRWAVRLGTCYLRQTTELAWGHGDAWDLAVQVAHRPGISDDLHQALVGAVRDAVQLVLDNRNLGLPQTT